MDCDLSLHRLIGKGDTYPTYTYTDRPSEWPDIAGDIGPTDEKMVALFRVNDSDSEFCSLQCFCSSSGTYSVDWGDGTSTTGIASGTRADHTYDYADVDLTSTSYGYKIAKVVVTPDSGTNITNLTLTTKNSTNQPSTTVVLNWLDIDIRFPSMVTIQLANSNYRNNVVKFRLRASSIFAISFSRCHSLEYIEELVSSNAFDTYAFNNMFQYCYKLQAFPANIDVSNGTHFAYMFNYCYSLRWLPNSFSIPNAVNTSYMFAYCSSLTRLPDTLDLSGVTNTSYMFQDCYSLTKLPDVLDVSSVTYAESMFVNCRSLTELPDVLDFSSVTNTSFNSIFNGCSSLTKVPDVLDFTTTGYVITNAFLNCHNIKSIPSLNTTGVTGTGNMFQYCYNLEEIGPLDFSSVTNMTSTFSQCYNLKKIGSFTPPTSNTVSTTNVFNQCYQLLEVPSGFKFYLASGTLSFTECYSLRRIPSATWGTLFSINLGGCSLDATALDEIYTSLPTVTSKTITVAGNPGVAGDTPSIATAKGWTVSG